MDIKQGDIFWVDLDEPLGSEPGYRRPHVVIQNNLYNNSSLDTIIVCALTTNLKRRRSPENVLLKKGEANLPKQSMVIVSQIFTVDRRDLVEKIGSLPRQRIRQILKGIHMLTTPSVRNW
ncbi:type II toxin-antitoxin system PemK/MazF family toxin [candidate division KSB3 bacterium]|uniref:mRNA interferase n=1 Tax=candidate division KSB3 bacterium TaxID=2044937 RepID=A0A9D5JZR3_9BACT|nr:type II toxin-antitoxin system PemK/MazF family toxin [candidate division KSB3 bacterium]MBD3326771.1 type II toxin-antitoxin system PemK/MazF family toxin [candidate division KSB3 bacterium]